jgi:hypothetical protein
LWMSVLCLVTWYTRAPRHYTQQAHVMPKHVGATIHN